MSDVIAGWKADLNSSVIGDILDVHGLYRQFLPAGIRALTGTSSVVGRAMPVLMTDVYGPQDQPFGKLTAALDQMEPGEVYIATGGLHRCAYWGEILTTTARMRRAAGAVIDGYHRDTHGIVSQEWPVFSRGSFGQDSSVRTKVTDYRCRIEIEGVVVEPGDIVFGDVDGVVIIPRHCEAEIIAEALEKVRSEKMVLREIEKGLSSTQAFEKYRVL
jgi:4-hydroxy-4-methyl-2-oxoglutarate aldolase